MKPVICAAFLFLSACCADVDRPIKPVDVEMQEIDCLHVLKTLGTELYYVGNSEFHVMASAVPPVVDQATGDEIRSEWYSDASFSFHEFCARMPERVVMNSRTRAEFDLTNFIVTP